MQINHRPHFLNMSCLCALGLGLSGCGARAVPQPELKPPVYEEPEPAPILFEREPDGAQILQDEAITGALEDELAELGARPSCGMTSIDVEVERGIAVLEGAVPTLLHAEVAIEKAATVRGVRSVVDRLRPAPAAIADEEIEANIRSRLEEDPATRDAEIDVASQVGRVRLEGAAGSYTEKELAREIAAAQRGVRHIDNDIRVVPEPRSDADIESDVVARLAYDAYLADNPIDVEVSRGVVLLTGPVGSFMEKRRAGVLGWVSGVVGVDGSRLWVDLALQDRSQRQARPLPTDEQIARAVSDAFELDPRIPDEAVDVRVSAGIAQLRGAAPNLLAKRAAEQIAADTVGVWRVENRIAVRPPVAVVDAELAERVRVRLAEAELVASEPIDVEVEAARVVIRAAIDDPVRRSALMRSVAAIPGVVDVVIDPSRTVRRWDGPGDEMLEREIERSLWWDSRVDSSTIDVDVRDGVAIIRGQVPTRVSREAVMENAWSAGPRAVEDQLVVSKLPPS